MSACVKCEGWGCRLCRPSTYSETDAPGVESAALPALQGRVAYLEAVLEVTLGNLRSLKGNAFKDLDTLDEWLAAVEAAVGKRGEVRP